jgi:hypothetical protein
LRSLLGQRLAVLGDLDEDKPMLTVVPWSGDVDSVVDRAIGEWRALKREPNLAEICWIELTDSGRQVANESLRND